METRSVDQKLTDKIDSARRTNAAAWGLFSLWMGIALLTHVGAGATLLGIGIIIVASQAALNYAGHAWDRFWATAGLLFVGAGVWNLLDIKREIFPFLCIAAGVIFLFSMAYAGPRHQS